MTLNNHDMTNRAIHLDLPTYVAMDLCMYATPPMQICLEQVISPTFVFNAFLFNSSINKLVVLFHNTFYFKYCVPSNTHRKNLLVAQNVLLIQLFQHFLLTKCLVLIFL